MKKRAENKWMREELGDRNSQVIGKVKETMEGKGIRRENV